MALVAGSVQTLVDALARPGPAPAASASGRAGPPGPIFDSDDYGTKVFVGVVADKVRRRRAGP